VKQRRVEAAALVIEGPEGLLLKAREGRTLGGLWGLPFEEGEGAVNRLLAGRDQVEQVGQLRHDFTHKRLEITVFTAAAIDGDALVDPTTVPLATLDRKVLALHRGG
jgi:A/G-specific adenine glycosylase